MCIVQSQLSNAISASPQAARLPTEDMKQWPPTFIFTSAAKSHADSNNLGNSLGTPCAANLHSCVQVKW